MSVLILHNNILRIIIFTYHPIDKDQLFHNTGILPFNILVKYRNGLFMHTLPNGNVPMPLPNLYQCNKNVHHHFTRHTYDFHSMRGNCEFVYRTFVFQSGFIWNTIVQNINTNVSFARFNHLLKDLFII